MKISSILLKLGSMLTTLCVAAATALNASEPEAEFYLSGGWRGDNLRSFITTNIDSSSDLMKGSDLNIWQVGMEGRFSPTFDQCDPFWNQLFARGSVYWGWISEGIYRHKIVTADPFTGISNDRGDISRGQTFDYTVGGGYLYPFSDCVSFGPTGGYSMNHLCFKTENVMGVITAPIPVNAINQTENTSIDNFSYFDENAKITSKWQGPWAGCDAVIRWSKITLKMCYEYHWAHWNGSFRSRFANLTDDYHYSDKRKGRNGHGQVGFLGISYSACSGMTMGLGVKYEYYSLKKGREYPDAEGGFPAVGGPENQIDYVNTLWHSLSILLNLGYVF